MFNKISIYLSENPTLRYWIIRPEWVAVILLILSIIASIQLSPFFADMGISLVIFIFILSRKSFKSFCIDENIF